jgi:hypothetical protein
LPADGEGDGDWLGPGDPDPLSVGDGEPEDDPDAELLGDAGLELGGAELGGGATGDFVCDGGGGDVRAGGVELCDVEGLLVVATGALVLGPGDEALADAFALADADAAAADAEFSLTCADAPA